MLRIFECLSFCLLAIFIQKANGNYYSNPDELMRHLKQYASQLKETVVTCKTNQDCLEGFFCKNNDCIAKRQEGSFCLSSRDDECMCGKCETEQTTWNKICSSESFDGECRNSGLSPFNNCNSNSECPKGYFCDLIDGKVCTSKLPPGRLCFNDAMCACGKCEEISHLTRINKPLINFNVCGSC